MVDILKIGVLFSAIALLEWSFSSFLSSAPTTHFFLFSFFLALSVKRGFLPTLPVALPFIFLFDGIFSGSIGGDSFFLLLLMYGSGFLLRRVNFEQFGGRFFFSVVMGIGMSLYPIGVSLLVDRTSFLSALSSFSFAGWLWSVCLGAVIFFCFLLAIFRWERNSEALGNALSL